MLSVYLRYLLFLVIFLCIIDAINATSRNRQLKSHNRSANLTRKYDRHSLVKYLKSKPKLWTSRKLSKERIKHYRNRINNFQLTKKHVDMREKAHKQSSHVRKHINTDNLPEYFDSREKWSHCTSIREIRVGNIG
jgi:hypothetical protein